MPNKFRYNSNESTEYLKMQMKDLIEPQMRLLVKENKNIILQDDVDDGVFAYAPAAVRKPKSAMT